MNKTFSIGQGNTPKLVDTLSDENGPVNLSGMTVQFVIQGQGGVAFARTGGIEDAAAGKVNYQFVAEDSAAPGDYKAQWKLTAGAVTRTFPGEDYICFRVQPALPSGASGPMSRFSDFYDDIRAVAGDHNRRRYQDRAIEGVMRVVVRGNRVPGYALGQDRMSIAPGIPDSDPDAYLRLVYHCAKMLLLPNVKASGYRTRALSERFGEQRDFLVDLENTLHELENGGATWSNVHGLRAWLFNLQSMTYNSSLLIPWGDVFPLTIFL